MLNKAIITTNKDVKTTNKIRFTYENVTDTQLTDIIRCKSTLK